MFKYRVYLKRWLIIGVSSNKHPYRTSWFDPVGLTHVHAMEQDDVDDTTGWKVVTRRRWTNVVNNNSQDTSSSEQPLPLNSNGNGGFEGTTTVTNNRRKPAVNEVCWFYNNRGCYRKDGTLKPESECRFLHVQLDPSEKLQMKKPSHLGSTTDVMKPCDKYNINKRCSWGLTCKYSHRLLTIAEWQNHYPDVSYNPPSPPDSLQPSSTIVTPVTLPPASQPAKTTTSSVVVEGATNPISNRDTSMGTALGDVNNVEVNKATATATGHHTVGTKHRIHHQHRQQPTASTTTALNNDITTTNTATTNNNHQQQQPMNVKTAFSKISELETRMSILDFKFKCHDEQCERRLSILSNLVSYFFNDLLKNPNVANNHHHHHSQ